MSSPLSCARCGHLLSAEPDAKHPAACPQCGHLAPAGKWWVGRPPPEDPKPAWWQAAPVAEIPLADAASVMAEVEGERGAVVSCRAGVGTMVGVAFGLCGLLALTAGALVWALGRLPETPRPGEGPVAIGGGPEEPAPPPSQPPKRAYPSPGEGVKPKPREIPKRSVAPKPPAVSPSVPERPAEPNPETPPAVEPEPARPEFVYKRRRDLSEEDLKKQIVEAREIALDKSRRDRTITNAVAMEAKRLKAAGKEVDLIPLLSKKRADLAGLPLADGDECRCSPQLAEHLEGGSLALRGHLNRAVKASGRFGGAVDPRPDPKVLHEALNAAGDRYNKWLKPEAVPALQQLLMPENEAVREVLVDQLAQIEGKRASRALANRALFDLNPTVRKRALEALDKRPHDQYRKELLAGFSYPWDPIADHAAEALVSLRMMEAVPELLATLDRPDPARPYTKEVAGRKKLYVKEMVRINHLRNCVMCHAVSTTTDDKVRGFVPPVDQPLPPPFTRAYYAPRRQGIFVRADITYLKQDFSVPLDVPEHDPWPATQRFDFMVMERPATKLEALGYRKGAEERPSEQRKALFFALRELTGKDPGPTAEDWKRLFSPRKGKARLTAHEDFLVRARALAVGPDGQVVLGDPGLGKVLRVPAEGRMTALLTDLAVNDLAFAPDGRLLALDAKDPRLIEVNPATGEKRVLAAQYRGKPFGELLHLAVDRQGGAYFTEAGKGRGALYYRSPVGTTVRLRCDLDHPTGLGLSPEGKTLYVVGARSREVMAYPLESAGQPKEGKVLARLAGPGVLGSAGLAVDGRGNVYVANMDARAVQVFNPGGAKLSLIEVPQTPRACVVAGEGEKAVLHVATSRNLYTLDLGAGSAVARE
jgi:sugar lactone lactonase YvrE